MFVVDVSKVDASKAIVADTTLAPFTAADYRPSVFWFRHVDMAAMLVLSLVLVFWSQPSTAASIIFKAVVSISCSLLLVALLWRVRPYPGHATWKLRVRTFALVLTAFAALTNGMTGLSDKGLGDDSLGQAIEVLAMMLVISCAGLLLTLIVAFAHDMIRGARKEQTLIERRRRSTVRYSGNANTPANIINGAKTAATSAARAPTNVQRPIPISYAHDEDTIRTPTIDRSSTRVYRASQETSGRQRSTAPSAQVSQLA
jgi:hypothetical protein